MGYGERKRTAERNRRLIKRVVLGILLFCLLAIAVVGHFYPFASWKYYVSKPKISSRKSGELRIHFLDVGQGDCTLVELPDGKTALIDGGEQSGYAERSLLRTLNALKIDAIDYLIVTHTDEDHCGALEEFLRYKKVVNAYLPAASALSDGVYASFYADVIKEAECYVSSRKVQLSSENTEYPYVFSFLLPYQYNAESARDAENESSAVIWLDYQGVSALFTGDAPAAVLEGLIVDEAAGYLKPYGVALHSTEILKVSHHGAKDGTSGALLEYMQTETAVISCGEENLYGHPNLEVLELFAAYGTKVFRTDKQENILITVRENGEYFVSTYEK